MADELDDKDRQELLERRMAENVQERVWKNCKIYGIVFTVGLTVCGLVSLSSIFGYLSREVTERVAAKIEKDTGELHHRVETDLADIVKAQAKLDLSIGEAQKQLTLLEDKNKEFSARLTSSKGLQQSVANAEKGVQTNVESVNRLDREFKERFDTVQKSFDTKFASVNKTAASALLTADRSSLAATGLQTSLALLKGIAAIYSAPQALEDGTITGVNFGDQPGNVYVQPRIRRDLAFKYAQRTDDGCASSAFADAIISVMVGNQRRSLAEKHAIQDWSPTKISLKISTELKSDIEGDAVHNNRHCEVDPVDLEYGYIVEPREGGESALFFPIPALGQLPKK